MLVASSFGGESKPLELSSAILIYTSRDRAAATVNPIALNGKNQPEVGPGQPLTRDDLEKVAASLDPIPEQKAKARSLLPENLLAADHNFLLWWLPSTRRKIFFTTGDKTFDADLNGRDVLHPALVVMARRDGLWTWAMAESKRPTESTALFRAPYFNFYDLGHMCQGSFRYPQHFRPDGIPEWERGLFDTNFAHTNIDMRQLTKHEHGHNALWREMAKTRARHFPVKYLVPLKDRKGKKQLTLAEAVER